jgi:hypothetical protein
MTMENLTICKICGGQVAPYDYVCDYCGTVIFENVRTTDNSEQGTLSFEDGMSIVRENLNALHDIPKPTTAKAINSALRVLVALFTLGIVLIFWRRPKKRFNKDVYGKLNSIITRNISFLKISSKGSNDLMSRIKVYEDELYQFDKEVKRGLFIKTISLITVLVLYLAWFVWVANSDPKIYSTYKVVPFDTIARGNISQYLEIMPDTVKISHTKAGESAKWELDVKLKLNQLSAINEKNLKVQVNIFLTDNKGVEIEGFKPGELIERSQIVLRQQLSNPDSKPYYFKFKISNTFESPDYIDTIPPVVTKFIIIADTIRDTKKY